MKTSKHQPDKQQDTPTQSGLEPRPFASQTSETTSTSGDAENIIQETSFKFINVGVGPSTINRTPDQVTPIASISPSPTDQIQRLLSRDDLEAWEEVHSGSKRYPKLLDAMSTYEGGLKTEPMGSENWITQDSGIKGVQINPTLSSHKQQHQGELVGIRNLANAKKKDRPLLGRVEEDVAIEIEVVDELYKDDNRADHGSTAHEAIRTLRKQKGKPSKPLYLDATKIVDDPTWEDELQQRDDEDQQLKKLWQKHEKLLEKPNSQPKVRQVAKVLKKIEEIYNARQARLDDVIPKRASEGTGHKLFMYGFSYTPFLGSLVQFMSGFLAQERIKSLEQISESLDLDNAPMDQQMHGKLMGKNQKEEFSGLVGGVGNLASCSVGMFMPLLTPLLQGQVLEAIANKGLTTTLDTVIPVVGSQMVGNETQNSSPQEMQDQMTFELFKSLRTVDKTPYGLDEFIAIMDARSGSPSKLQNRIQQDSSFTLRVMLILDERLDASNRYDQTGEQGQAAMMRIALQQGLFANPRKAIATHLSGTSGKTKAMLKRKLENYMET